MTIHHDKLAYGKLASQREDVSEERLLKMLVELNSAENCGECEKEDGASVNSENGDTASPADKDKEKEGE